MMRIVPLIILLFAMSMPGSLPVPAVAAGFTPAKPEVDRAEQLDRLFARLCAAPDAVSAREITDRIWTLWISPKDPQLAALVDRAFKRRHVGDYDGAIQVLDRIIANWPDYAEGWNQRATIHFLRKDYEASLMDIAETLAREPRHFGALAGRAVIRLRQGKRALAMQNVSKALEIHPFLPEKGLFPELSPIPKK